ncbi:hypothetical protein [Bacillus sp. FJAT-49736]|uniref:hypothetical protein n=1 Tax=Bacillus sp. FJAT-49736 TaxID=2833582 RepID=UPI001BCA02E9|nr:hypothetical protein [Bacillus sp. FJAT-49736]MBS4172719.1 hypothetical protein [Bacillus sp. FJAT-49736]
MELLDGNKNKNNQLHKLVKKLQKQGINAQICIRPKIKEHNKTFNHLMNFIQ